jgi:hypothetical protein
VNENEVSRDEGKAVRARRLDGKTLIVVVGFCVGLILLIALNMK